MYHRGTEWSSYWSSYSHSTIYFHGISIWYHHYFFCIFCKASLTYSAIVQLSLINSPSTPGFDVHAGRKRLHDRWYRLIRCYIGRLRLTYQAEGCTIVRVTEAYAST